MANTIIGWPIYSDVGKLYTPTLSGGSWAASLPLANVQDRRLHKIARSFSAAMKDTRFMVDIGADRAVRVFSFVTPSEYWSSLATWRVLGVPTTSGVLFAYEAGMDIATLGGTFSRADATTCATYVDRYGVLRTVAANILRDGHFINGQLRTLIEGTATNLVLQSENFSSTWSVNGSPTNTGPIHANSGVGLDLLGDNSVGTASGFYQPIAALTGNGAKGCSLFIKPGTATTSVFALQDTTAGGSPLRLEARISWSGGVPSVVMTTGTYLGYVIMNDGFRLLFQSSSATAANSHRVWCLPACSNFSTDAASQGNCYMGGVMVEDIPFPSSYIKTTTTTVTRAAETLYFTFTAPPQALSLYSKFVANHPSATGFGLDSVLIGTTASGFETYFGSIARAIQWNGANSTSDATLSNNTGDTIEMLGTLTSTGVATANLSVNGGSPVVGAAGSAIALPGSLWGTQTLTVGGGSGTMWAGLTSIRVMAGVQTFTTMQNLIMDSGWMDVLPAGATAETLEGMNLSPVYTPSADFTGRYFTFLFSDQVGHAVGYIDISRVIVAKGWQPTINILTGAKVGIDTDSTRTITPGGAATYDVRRQRRSADFTVDVPSAEAQANGFQMQRVAGIDKQMMWIFDPSDTTYGWMKNFLGTLRELTALEYPYVSLFNRMAFSITEEL